jgi:hypothetical protein
MKEGRKEGLRVLFVRRRRRKERDRERERERERERGGAVVFLSS